MKKDIEYYNSFIAKTFGNLTIKEFVKVHETSAHTYIKASCQCGNMVVLKLKSLINGCKTCCGCCRSGLMIGTKINYLTIISIKVGQRQNSIYCCQCVCGNQIEMSYGELNKRRRISCGCKKAERLNSDLTNHPLYRVWAQMKTRCSNTNFEHYKYYGGKGISVCEEWKKSFKSFLDWSIENGWKSGLQIDRINSSGDYEPANCRWITPVENSRRSSHTKINMDIARKIRNSDLSVLELSKMYDLSKSNINSIRKNRIWMEK